jgi:hypothetical protein
MEGGQLLGANSARKAFCGSKTNYFKKKSGKGS